MAQNSSLFCTLVFSENVTTIGWSWKSPTLTSTRSREDQDWHLQQRTTFLSMNENGVSDASENGVSKVSNTNATSASNFAPDSSPPTLMSFNVDLNRGEITFRFSETVDNRSFTLTSYTLQDSCPQTTIMDLMGNGSNASNSTSNSTDLRSYTLTGN